MVPEKDLRNCQPIVAGLLPKIMHFLFSVSSVKGDDVIKHISFSESGSYDTQIISQATQENM